MDESALTPAHALAQGMLTDDADCCENCVGFNRWHSPDSHRVNRERLQGAMQRQATRDAERQRESDAIRSQITNQENKSMSNFDKSTGNPVPSPVDPNTRKPGSRALAYRHGNLRQGSTDMTPFANCKPENTQGYAGAMAMSGEGHRQGMMLATQEPVVDMQRLTSNRAPETTATYRAPRSGSPDRKPSGNSARGSATKPGPARTLSNPTSRLPASGSGGDMLTPNRANSQLKSAFAELQARGVNAIPWDMDSVRNVSN